MLFRCFCFIVIVRLCSLFCSFVFCWFTFFVVVLIFLFLLFLCDGGSGGADLSARAKDGQPRQH